MKMGKFHLHTLVLSEWHICNEQGILQESKQVPEASEHNNKPITRYPHCLESDCKFIFGATSNKRIIFRDMYKLKIDNIDDFIAFFCILVMQVIVVIIFILTRNYHQSGKFINHIQAGL